MASEQITYENEKAELPNALEDNEIARLMKLVGDSSYKKSENAPTRRKEEFKARTLVEIAMEAQQKRNEEEKVAKEEPIKADHIIDKEDTNTQELEAETTSNNLNTDRLNSSSVAPNATTHIGEKEEPKSLNSSDKQQVSDDAETSEENSQELTVSKNSEIEETPKTEKTQDGLAEHLATEIKLSKAIEDATIRYDEGYRTGLEAGKNEMKEALEQKFSEQQKTFDALISSLTKMNFAETKELETDIQAAILSLASERAGVAILDMPENFLARIEKLMSRVDVSVDSPVIKLNKDDLEHIKRAKEQSETLKKLSFKEEERLNHGDICISIAGIEIEDILKNRITIPTLASDTQVNIEKPNSESKAENSDSPERLNTVTGIDNTPKKIGENDTLALEATEAVEPKVEEGERDIEDKSTNIIKKDEPS